MFIQPKAKSCTELYFQIFYSLSVAILFENSLKKLLGFSCFNSCIEGAMTLFGCQYTPFLGSQAMFH